MACQRGTSRRWVRSDGGSEAVGAMLRGKPGAGVEGEQEVEVEAEAEGEAGGVPLTILFCILFSLVPTCSSWALAQSCPSKIGHQHPMRAQPLG